MYQHKSRYQDKINKSFTIVELIIVMFIFFTIGVLFYNSFFNVSLDYSYLKNDSETIKQILIKAKQKSILSENNSPWGVYFENSTTDVFYLFQGNDFSTTSVYEKYNLNHFNRFVNPPENSSTQIVFSKFFGYTNTTTQIIIKNYKSDIFSTITINYFGNIDYQIK